MIPAKWNHWRTSSSTDERARNNRCSAVDSEEHHTATTCRVSENRRKPINSHPHHQQQGFKAGALLLLLPATGKSQVMSCSDLTFCSESSLNPLLVSPDIYSCGSTLPLHLKVTCGARLESFAEFNRHCLTLIKRPKEECSSSADQLLQFPWKLLKCFRPRLKLHLQI